MKTLSKARKSDNPIRKAINQNFVIRITNRNTGERYLVGAGQYLKHIKNEKLAQKHFNEVLSGQAQNYCFKLRSGLQIDFRGK